MSVAELARRVGVERSTITRIESGKSFPGARIGKFARALQVTLVDLFSFPGPHDSQAPSPASAISSEYPAIYAALRKGLKADPRFAWKVERILETLIAK